MIEIWKDIPNYEGYYKVSNLGRIKTVERLVSNKTGYRKVKERVKSQYKSKRGYYSSKLSKLGIRKTEFTHQLVAMAFLNHKPDGYKLVVDHIDGDTTNNCIDNLQLISQRENTTKNSKGTSKFIGVFWNKFKDKWCSSIHINKKTVYLGAFDNEYDAHLAYQYKLKELGKC